MRKLDRVTIVNLTIVSLIVLLVLGVWISQRDNSGSDRLSDRDARQPRSDDDPAVRCGSQRTYDLIKRDLFRRAARMRGTDASAFDRLSAAAVVRMDDPVMTGRDEDLGTLSCSGRLSLDLPPGVAVIGGRRTLQADLVYRLQPAADGSGDVPMLEGAEAIVVPLASLATIESNDRSPIEARTPPVADGSGAGIPAPAPRSTVAPAPRPSVAPSFDCRRARTRSEIAVCSDNGLAALDRQMAAQFQRAMTAADPRRRQWLVATRDSFLRYRDRCDSSGCIADSYRGRMREIDDIMSGRWRPQR